MRFVLSVDVLNYFHRSLGWNHVPQSVGAENETSVPGNVDRHRVDIRFGRDNKLV